MTNVDPNKFYNINEIFVLGLFPWIRSYGAIRRYLDFDRLHDNVLQTQVKPRNIDSANTGLRYFIKGENIINLLARYEDGSLFFNYEPMEKKPNGRSIEKA